MKPNPLSRPTLFIVACLLALGTSAASAQSQDRWFRVELLVFGQGKGSSEEAWQAIPELAYPPANRFLVEPQRVAANQAEYASAASELDDYGRQLIRLTSGGSSNQTGGNGESGGATVSPATPTPFRVLPASQREFRGKAAYMQRTGRYTTLFHQVWLQPVAARDRALPIVIDRSGDTGEWPALQGSITLHLSRYLHLETNLWLNTPGNYLSGEWRMPAPPLGPPSLIIENSTAQPGAVTPRASLPEPDAGTAPDEAQGTGEFEQGPVYPYRHAVLLQQKRRMRSNEVHYLDHPLMGVVIKLRPLVAEDLALLKQAEESGNYPPLDS